MKRIPQVRHYAEEDVMRRLLMLIVALLVAVSIHADPMGFVWADNPSAPSYTPNANYAFNSSGGAIRIDRASLGSYRVTFEHLARGRRGGGNMQVTPYGGGDAVCNVVGWSGTDDLIVSVRCHVVGAITDSRFTLLATWPPDVVLKPLQLVPTAIPAKPSVRITPEGHVVKTYPDGRIVETFDGGKTVTVPGRGSQTMLYSTGAPAAIPPEAPSGNESKWLEWHAQRLLDVIQAMGGEEGLASYKQSEAANLSVYARIAKRRDTIAWLEEPAQ
jgi:hypothetical protein